MSDVTRGSGWWLASDGKWYPPELRPAARATARTVEAPAAPSTTPADGAPRSLGPDAVVVRPSEVVPPAAPRPAPAVPPLLDPDAVVVLSSDGVPPATPRPAPASAAPAAPAPAAPRPTAARPTSPAAGTAGPAAGTPGPDDMSPYYVKVTGTWDAPPPGAYTTGRSPRTRRNRQVVLLAVAIVAVLGIGIGVGVAVSGTGTAPPVAPTSLVSHPRALVSNSADAMVAARTVRLEATTVLSGRPSTLALSIGTAGGSGTVTVGTVSYQVIGSGATLYVRGTAHALDVAGMPAATALADAGTWVAVGPHDQMLLSGVRPLLDIATVADDLVRLDPPLHAVGNSAAATGVIVVNGVLPASDLTAASGTPATLLVASSTPGLPVRVSYVSPTFGTSVFEFTAWGTTVVATAPAHSVPWTAAG